MASTRDLPPDWPKTSLAKAPTRLAGDPGARGKWAANVAHFPLANLFHQAFPAMFRLVVRNQISYHFTDSWQPGQAKSGVDWTLNGYHSFINSEAAG